MTLQTAAKISHHNSKAAGRLKGFATDQKSHQISHLKLENVNTSLIFRQFLWKREQSRPLLLKNQLQSDIINIIKWKPSAYGGQLYVA